MGLRVRGGLLEQGKVGVILADSDAVLSFVSVVFPSLFQGHCVHHYCKCLFSLPLLPACTQRASHSTSVYKVPNTLERAPSSESRVISEAFPLTSI